LGFVNFSRKKQIKTKQKTSLSFEWFWWICRLSAAAAMMGTTETRPGSSRRSSIPPPVHPTYDLQQLIRLALAEDAGDRGKLLSKNDVGGDNPDAPSAHTV
jgi:hypothetical protein